MKPSFRTSCGKISSYVNFIYPEIPNVRKNTVSYLIPSILIVTNHGAKIGVRMFFLKRKKLLFKRKTLILLASHKDENLLVLLNLASS